ncbi:hypothetical protein DM15PD_14760 [Aristophania vespae]|nr:hypothetical protein DM15PD_14760 [Aristophania vespae]
MNNPGTWLHIWGYVVASYVIVISFSAYWGISTFLRFGKSVKRLKDVEQITSQEEL